MEYVVLVVESRPFTHVSYVRFEPHEFHRFRDVPDAADDSA
jgi:hypothetical protein